MEQKKYPQLKLIQGGALAGNGNVQAEWRSNRESQTLLASCEERLRQAILFTVVEELGRTVDEVLCEMNEKLDSEEFPDHSRFTQLGQSLVRRGLLYMAAPPHLDLECNGYITVSNVKRLLALQPELAVYRPEDHQLLTIGELPVSFRRTLRPATLEAGVPLLSPKAEPKRKSGAGYFDEKGETVWAQESNRLRHTILRLRLEDVGVSVQQALDELCELNYPRTEDEEYRKAVLRRALEYTGLQFREASEFPVPGYLTLSWPDRLLRNFPQLAALHPRSWHALQIA